MRSIFILISFCICSISFSQVVATGDTTLCENMAGQVELTLTAESFNVDLSTHTNDPKTKKCLKP